MKKNSFFLMILLILISACNFTNSPTSVIEEFIEGVQTNNAEIIWKLSDYSAIDKTLLEAEKKDIFNKFLTDDFSNKENKRFQIFKKDAQCVVFAEDNTDDGRKSNVFVEISYKSLNAYVINKFQTGKKIKVKFILERKEDTWQVVNFEVDKIIEFNKKYDNENIISVIKNDISNNLGNAIKSYNSIKSDYSDYFQEISSIRSTIENEIETIYSKEKKTSNNNAVSVYSKDYEHTYKTYTTDTYTMTEYYDGYSTTSLKGGKTESDLQGVIIKGKVKNKLNVTSISVKLKISFETQRKSNQGYDCNSLLYEPRRIVKYVTIGPIKPKNKGYFAKFIHTDVTGETQRGMCFGWTDANQRINSSTLKITPVAVYKKGKMKLY